MSAIIQHYWESKTPEQRSALAQKAHATRRRNKEAREAAKAEQLARLDPLTAKIAELEARNARLEAHAVVSGIAGVLTGKRLLTPDELVNASSEYETTCGVYFLIYESRVVYVGQSVNIYSRMATHAGDKYNPKAFDRFCFIRCPAQALDVLESLYIHTLKPELNGTRPGGGKDAPIGWDTLIDKASRP